MKKAVVLLSGGLDSAVTLYWAINKGYSCLALNFDYGQRHRKEIKSAKKIAQRADCSFYTVKFHLPWQGSALLNKKIILPTRKSVRGIGKDIPSTYVPARNTLFLSFAISLAEVVSATTIFIGANALDYSGYPDCRPDFIQAMQRTAELGTKVGREGKKINIFAPLIKMTKSQIIKTALALEVPLKLSWSCYQGGKHPCGHCDSCLLRAKGFAGLGLKDPAT
ncbi:MAG: 7-cyano-7-deazaguanine synthase QueC [Elusimicrobiota bacterium]